MTDTAALEVSPSLLDEPATIRDRRISSALIALLVVATVAASPFHGQVLRVPAFIPAFAGITGTADAIAAAMLLRLYRVDGTPVLLAMAAAYALNAFLIVPYTLTFPGVIDARGFLGNEQSAAWLWTLWHASFPLLIFVGVRSRQAPSPHRLQHRDRTIATVAGGCAIFAALVSLWVTAGRSTLPVLVHGGTFSPLFRVLASAAACANVAVVIRLVLRRRPLPAFFVWLIVALSASALDTILNTLAVARYSLSWYVGKTETFTTASIVLVALLSTSFAMYERSAVLTRTLARTIADGVILQRQLTREHEIAATLQQVSLPRELPAAAGFTLHATYRPAISDLTVGGDWYDAFILDDGRLAITIGDVAGHGLAASVIMSKLRQSLRLAAAIEPDPARMLGLADMALRSEHPETIATAFVGLLDRASGILRWACAGHPPPMIRSRNADVMELDGPAPPLGIYDASSVATNSVTLAPQSLLVAYTDGLIEAGRDVIAGLTELRQTLQRLRTTPGRNPAETLLEAIVGDERRDDIAIITMAYDGPPVEAHFRRPFVALQQAARLNLDVGVE